MNEFMGTHPGGRVIEGTEARHALSLVDSHVR